MYKSTSLFQQRLARKPRKGSPRRIQLWRLDKSRLLLDRLDAEVAKVTPSLRKRNEPMKRIYFIRFTLLADRHHTFVKIGITSNSIDERFILDIDQYCIEVIIQSSFMPSKIAVLREAALHREFKRFSYRPLVYLRSGGNTECYTLYGKPFYRVIEIIKSWI